VLLYDLTSSYVEGAAEKNPMMRRGYSRDHRPDCEQMVIALIVNSEGFPFSYETFDVTAPMFDHGNDSAHGGAQIQQTRRITVFDRGIVGGQSGAIRKRSGSTCRNAAAR
jgi:hypothetical protein